MEIYMPSTLNYGRQTIAELEINPVPHVELKKKIVESHMSHTVTLLMKTDVVTFYDTLPRPSELSCESLGVEG